MPTFERAGKAARWYAARGWNPVPSRGDKKAPVCSFAALETGWDGPPVRRHVLGHWPGPNIQLMCGARWRLVAVDLDGPEAIEAWPDMGPCPDTWASGHDDNGRHLWFSIPPDRPCPSAGRLWGIREGDGWRRHTAVELLAARKLLMAPPSIHPKTGREYRFLVGPRDIPAPAPLPDWVRALPDLDRPPPPEFTPPPATPMASPPRGRYDAGHVLAAIPDKAALAASLGLRVTARKVGAGAVACHAIGRPDRTPSALINPETGRYWDPWIAGGRGIGFFDLARHLGVGHDFPSTVNTLGDLVGAGKGG